MDTDEGRPQRTGHPELTPPNVEASVQRRGDVRRRWRIRRWARRELDDLLDVEAAPVFTEEIDFHRTHLDRTVRERELIGARMAAAGWVP